MDARKRFILLKSVLTRSEALLLHKLLQFSKIYPLGVSAEELKVAIEHHGRKTPDEDISGLGSAGEIKNMIDAINDKYMGDLGLSAEKAPVIVTRERDLDSPAERYNLDPERIVTRYLTARILMELFRVAQLSQTPGDIDRGAIENYIEKQSWFGNSIYGWNKNLYARSFVKKRFDWLLSNEAHYLEHSSREAGHIVMTNRIQFEIQYIKLLCAFTRSEKVEVQPSPTKADVDGVEDTLPDDVSMEELLGVLEQKFRGEPFPELDKLKIEIREFCEELHRTGSKLNLYRAYRVWQAFGDAVQQQIKNKIFGDGDVKKVGIHVAARRRGRKGEPGAVVNYVEFRARGEESELRKMIGEKDSLEKFDEDFVRELLPQPRTLAESSMCERSGGSESDSSGMD